MLLSKILVVKSFRYHVSAVNSCPVSGTRFTQEGQQENVLEFIENERNFPVSHFLLLKIGECSLFFSECEVNLPIFFR